MTHVLLNIGFTFTLRQRRIAEESLNIAFGREKEPHEIKKITRDCFETLGQGIIEMLYFMSHPHEVKDKVTIVGEDKLKKALEENNGIIAVTAHFGNFPLMMLHCALQGYKTNAIIRRARDNNIEEFLLRKRTEAGLNTVYASPRVQCVRDSLKALRNNEILFIPMDQNFGSNGGVFVDFFGQKAATATGPVVFATRTKAKIIPMFIIRQADKTHKIVIEDPVVIEEGKDERDTLVKTTEKITKIIEKYIRMYPHEWGWMHRRWKSKPYRMQYVPNA